MKTYNFDEIIPRHGSDSYKWDSTTNQDVLPMWVADMDFRTAPPIIEELQQRVSHGIFGYTRVPDAYYNAVTNWFSRKHNWQIDKNWMIYTSGVVPAISAIIKALTKTEDKVIVQTPVYNCFFSSIRNNGCEILCNRLIYEHNTYRIDYEDLEQKASDPKARILLLCNPHNPAGRVWTINELKRIGEICIRHGIIVVSDEIHCELVYPGHRYIPFASISEDFLHQSVTCLSPSKSFNIAGLQIANIISFDENWRKKIDKAININEVCDVNPFGVRATIAAYNKGEEWLQQLISYLKANYGCFKDFCDKNLTDFPIAKLEGTYLVWMDCRKLDIPSEELERQLIKEAKLWLNAGTMYGQDGEGFMRWNIACPRTRMLEGLERFYKFINQSKA